MLTISCVGQHLVTSQEVYRACYYIHNPTHKAPLQACCLGWQPEAESKCGARSHQANPGGIKNHKKRQTPVIEVEGGNLESI